ncbi:MAG: hypothetical protein KA282_04275, partial [Clostridia bacterium]|nr:hypothetical protein [Clostridia bacterium]
MKFINLFKTHKAEKITAIIFMAIIFGMMSGLLFSARSLASGFLTDYRATVMPGTSISERVRGAAGSLERAVNNDLQNREDYVNIYGWIQKSMGKSIISDAGDGQLYK